MCRSYAPIDAREASAAAVVSRTKAKEALASDLDPEWLAASQQMTASVLRQLGADCTADASAVRLGRSAVSRALRRGELAALVVAREGGPPLSYAHLAALAQQRGVAVSLLACSSAQLGQPFGLLRASCVGLRAPHFEPTHPILQLIQRATLTSSGGGGASTGPLPWLKELAAPAAPAAPAPAAARRVESSCSGAEIAPA